VEVAYSENDVDKIDYNGPVAGHGEFDAGGTFGILTFMANFWYDIPLSEEVKPYLGGGVGIAIVDGDVHYEGHPDIFDDSQAALALQAGVGIRWQVSDTIALDVGYRLRAIDGPSFDNNEDFLANGGSYDADWMVSHNVIAGVSLGF